MSPQQLQKTWKPEGQTFKDSLGGRDTMRHWTMKWKAGKKIM